MIGSKKIVQLGIGIVGIGFSLLAQSQSFEPLDEEFNVDDAVVIPPPSPVVTAEPNNAQPGPAVVANDPNNNPAPTNTADEQETLGSFESVDLNSPNASISDANPNLQARSIAIQEQQLKRIEKVEQGLNKLVKKQSFSKSLMGTIISAATTADPVLAAVGGVAGFLIGKAEEYKEAEKKNYELEQDILRKSPYYYTDEELKLAAYANTELDPALMRPEQVAAYADYVFEARTRTRAGDFPGVSPPQQQDPVPTNPSQPEYQLADYALGSQAPANVESLADICSGYLEATQAARQQQSGVQNVNIRSRNGSRSLLSIADRRNLSRYCFYSLR